MAEINPPWALENLATHHANAFRSEMMILGQGAEGVASNLGLGQLLVTQRGAGANMSVDVAAGVCMVFGDEANTQGMYGCTNDSARNVTIAGADPSNPRRDLIVARVQDSAYSGGVNSWSLAAITGTPAGSPVDPAVPNNACVLARVLVGAAVSSIVNANITDLRPFTPLGVVPSNSARPPGTLYGAYSQAPSFKPAPQSGLMRYDIDTNLAYIFNGTVFVCITPQSNVVATGQSTTNTSYVDLATSGPAVTVSTGTKALVTVGANITNGTVTDGGAMSVAVSGGTVVVAADTASVFVNAVTAGQNFSISNTFQITSLNPGSNTFTAKYRAVAAGTATFTNRWITVVGIP